MAVLDPGLERDALNLGNELVNTEAMIEVARLAARDIGIVNNDAFNHLRVHLTKAYAQGYVRGLRIGRERKVTLPPPMSVPRT